MCIRDSSYIPKDHSSCTHVLVRHDSHRSPLRPKYDGPFPVILRKEKFTRTEVISIDRLKPAYFEANPPDVQDSDLFPKPIPIPLDTPPSYPVPDSPPTSSPPDSSPPSSPSDSPSPPLLPLDPDPLPFPPAPLPLPSPPTPPPPAMPSTSRTADVPLPSRIPRPLVHTPAP